MRRKSRKNQVCLPKKNFFKAKNEREATKKVISKIAVFKVQSVFLTIRKTQLLRIESGKNRNYQWIFGFQVIFVQISDPQD